MVQRRRVARIPGLVIAAVIAAVVALAGATAKAMETEAKYALLVDFETGRVLLQKDADTPMAPASMSKIMTAYMVFERLRSGQLRLDDTLPVSETAWRRGGAVSDGSTMYMPLGGQVKVEDLLRGIIVQSGNDACIVIAEGIAGSEEAFAELMTKRGKEIGLVASTFRNAHGLPDPDHVMSARDLAQLAKRTIEDFPEYYHYYSEKEFVFNKIRQGNRNPILYKDIGGDGLKTGHTSVSGYGLTASAKQGERRLILVVNGLGSMKKRSEESERLLSWGFREFNNYRLVRAGDAIAEAEVWLGDEPTVPLTAARDAVVTLPRKARPGMKAVVRYDGPVAAPVNAGDRVATLVVTAPEVEPIELPLVAAKAVDRRGMVGRMVAVVGHLVGFGTP
jgi:D-alanyl-D-alanine carboxypeptidase (penicillin-binding protein 5/6)